MSQQLDVVLCEDKPAPGDADERHEDEAAETLQREGTPIQWRLRLDWTVVFGHL